MQDQAAQSRPEAAHSASYTYTFADFRAVREAKRALSPVDQAMWRWRYVWVPACALLIMFALNWNDGLTVDALLSWNVLSIIALSMLGLIAFIAMVDILFDRVLARWVFKRYSMADKPLIVSFNDSGIIWSSEGFKGEFAWSKVKKIVTVRGDLFLFVSKLEALCVPQRAFPSKDAFDNFVIYAKERANG